MTTNSTITPLPLISTTFPLHLSSTPRLLSRPSSPWWDADLCQHHLCPSFSWWHTNLHQCHLSFVVCFHDGMQTFVNTPPLVLRLHSGMQIFINPAPPPSFPWRHANLHQCTHPLSFISVAACRFLPMLHHILHPTVLPLLSFISMVGCGSSSTLPSSFISAVACKSSSMCAHPLSFVSTAKCRSSSMLHSSFVCMAALSMCCHPLVLCFHSGMQTSVNASFLALCLCGGMQIFVNAAPVLCFLWQHANIHHHPPSSSLISMVECRSLSTLCPSFPWWHANLCQPPLSLILRLCGGMQIFINHCPLSFISMVACKSLSMCPHLSFFIYVVACRYFFNTTPYSL